MSVSVATSMGIAAIIDTPQLMPTGGGDTSTGCTDHVTGTPPQVADSEMYTPPLYNVRVCVCTIHVYTYTSDYSDRESEITVRVLVVVVVVN